MSSRSHSVSGRSRPTPALVLALLTVLHLLPLLPAFGFSDCFCDETMCVHRHRHAGSHAVEDSASDRAMPAGAHCELAAKSAPDCSMRGCSHERDQALLSLGVGALPPATALQVQVEASALRPLAAPAPVDRLRSVETPPPDFLLV